MHTSPYLILKNKCKMLFEKAQKAYISLKLYFQHEHVCAVYLSYILNIESETLTLSLPVSVEDDSPFELRKWEKEITIYLNDNNRKYIFDALSIKQSHLVTESDELIETLLISKPKLVGIYPRRRSERISAAHEVSVKIFDLDSKTRSSRQTGKSLQGVLHNLSTGGLGVTINKQDLSELCVGDLCEICFVPMPGEEPVLLDARLRHVTELNERQQLLLGFQFAVQTLTEKSGNMLHRLNHIIKLYQ
jgi:hypothetical protein